MIIKLALCNLESMVILRYVSGSRAGVVGIYQRHRFETEARVALVSWGEHITATIEPSDSARRATPSP
jgi:hypothetical protein